MALTSAEIHECLSLLAGEVVYVKLPDNHPVRFKTCGTLKYIGEGRWTISDGEASFPETHVIRIPDKNSHFKTIILRYE